MDFDIENKVIIARRSYQVDFDIENQVIIASMNQEEAVAFIKFLRSEILRHKRDISEAYGLIVDTGRQFHMDVLGD